MTCHYCGGSGEQEETRDASPSENNGGLYEESRYVVCEHCDGTGTEPESEDSPCCNS